MDSLNNFSEFFLLHMKYISLLLIILFTNMCVNKVSTLSAACAPHWFKNY